MLKIYTRKKRSRRHCKAISFMILWLEFSPQFSKYAFRRVCFELNVGKMFGLQYFGWRIGRIWWLPSLKQITLGWFQHSNWYTLESNIYVLIFGVLVKYSITGAQGRLRNQPQMQRLIQIFRKFQFIFLTILVLLLLPGITNI